MKKLALVLICILMLITLVACGDKTCQHRDADDNSLCDKCGESYTDGKDVFDEHTHDYNVKNTDSQYLATAADCQNPATYYYSCSCGIKGTQTFSSGSVAAHTPKSAVEENRVEATCTAGHYDSVVYCSVCDEELSRSTKTILAAHSFKNNNCTSCGIASGIEYFLNSDGKGYILKDSDLFLGGHLVVDTYQGLPVTSIGFSAFDECTSLTSITILSSVQNIDDCTFYNCSNLKTVTFGANSQLSSIGSSAFSYCTRLTSITIPDSVTSIGSEAFSGCTSLTSIHISASVQEVGSRAFYNCSNLKTVTFGANSQLSSIGAGAFNWCTSLRSIVIPDRVKSIGHFAFSDCFSLTSIMIPSSVQKVDDYAFAYCSNLKTVTFGENSQLSSIGSHAFYECTSLTSITIPDSVTSIDERAFWYCTSLTSITIPDSVTSIGYLAFSDCTSLTSIKYRGTQAQWEAITKVWNWNSDTGYYTITYNYTGE